MSSKRPIPQRPSGGSAPDTRTGHASDTQPINGQAGKTRAPAGTTHRTIRETIESVIVAFVLAFLFRTFEAEAFVIPTGSMAPTLQGRHKDLICPECGTHFRVSASIPTDEESSVSDSAIEVTEGTCPNCRFTMNLDPETQEGRKWPAYNGDRILVAKFPYDFSEPSRWDVIVFRYPLNGQMNFIKRLVGLPGETLRIDQGDIYVKPDGANNFEIERKPAMKVRAMAQDVYDNDHVVDAMTAAGWPLRWQPLGPEGAAWASPDGGRSFETPGGSGEAWIRYQHFTPFEDDWREMLDSHRVSHPPVPHLITDFYAYNTGQQRQHAAQEAPVGMHWVSDLMLDVSLDVRKAQGSIVLDLVKGGRHFSCEFNVETGQATLGIDGLADFQPSAQTSVRGTGRHRVSFANVDRKLYLWVDEDLVTFAAPTTYEDLDNSIPTRDDLAPAGIASRGADVKAEHLTLKRDIYYIAKRASRERSDAIFEYDFPPNDYRGRTEILDAFSDPSQWTRDGLFSWRRSVDFELEADQFFALGDNSPQSKDSRLWTEGDPNLEFYVRRELLIGQAMFIYWPASHNKIPYLNIPFPLFPNIQDMGFIR